MIGANDLQWSIDSYFARVGESEYSVRVISLVNFISLNLFANRESNQFRTVIENTGNDFMGMRQSMPIEEYLKKMQETVV